MNWPGDIPESAWSKRDPTDVLREALKDKPRTKRELLAAVDGSVHHFKQSIGAMMESGEVERTIWKRVAYFRLTNKRTTDGQGTQTQVME